jgi:hypothetical protein
MRPRARPLTAHHVYSLLTTTHYLLLTTLLTTFHALLTTCLRLAYQADLVAVFMPHASVAATWPAYVNTKFAAAIAPGASRPYPLLHR